MPRNNDNWPDRRGALFSYYSSLEHLALLKIQTKKIKTPADYRFSILCVMLFQRSTAKVSQLPSIVCRDDAALQLNQPIALMMKRRLPFPPPLPLSIEFTRRPHGQHGRSRVVLAHPLSTSTEVLVLPAHRSRHGCATPQNRICG